MEIQRLTGLLGAEITGADVTNAKDVEQLHHAFAQHSVIAIRDQHIDPTDLIAFAETFGTININRFFAAHPEHPKIALVVKEKDQTGAIGEEWHTDHAYDQSPAMGSILHGLEIPPYGGDTEFVSMGAAYDALSDKMKDMLTDLYAVHSSRHVFGETQANTDASKSGRIGNADLATQDALHPVVIKHPLSGRLGLFVNPQFTTHIDGLSNHESKALLDMLCTHCMRPEFHARVHWKPGTIAMWDNRATWHTAINDYHGHRRYMHRITVEGVPLTAA